MHPVILFSGIIDVVFVTFAVIDKFIVSDYSTNAITSIFTIKNGPFVNLVITMWIQLIGTSRTIILGKIK